MGKSADELIDAHVSSSQCSLAVSALLKHALKHKSDEEQNELLPGKEQFVWVNLAVKKVHLEKKLKPFKIPLSHPLIDPRTTPICLITKDPQREYKDLLESNGIKFISRVVGVQKLKGKFKPFEARRMLLKENGLFLADERVVPLLPKLLGKAFFNAKKQPIPVCMTRKELKAELEGAVSSTYFHQNEGTCSSIKIGTLGFHDEAQLLNNLKTSLPTIVKNVKGGWSNIQSIHIKTSSSASLPLWSCDLSAAEGGRWDGLTKVEAESEEEEADEEIATEAVAEPIAEPKGNKRPAPAAVAAEEPQKKKKKAKLVEKKSAPAVPEVDQSPKPASKKQVPPTPEPSTSTPTKSTTKRERKPRSSAVKPSAPEPSIPEPAPASDPSKKKKKQKSATDESTALANLSLATKAAPKDKTPVKAKAVASGGAADKKKEKVVGAAGAKAPKSKSGAGKTAKDGLLGKKAAGR